jgi:hypothetical protein
MQAKNTYRKTDLGSNLVAFAQAPPTGDTAATTP